MGFCRDYFQFRVTVALAREVGVHDGVGDIVAMTFGVARKVAIPVAETTVGLAVLVTGAAVVGVPGTGLMPVVAAGARWVGDGITVPACSRKVIVAPAGNVEVGAPGFPKIMGRKSEFELGTGLRMPPILMMPVAGALVQLLTTLYTW